MSWKTKKFLTDILIKYEHTADVTVLNGKRSVPKMEDDFVSLEDIKIMVMIA